MKFKKWLNHFKDIDRPVGDLASDILRDKDFPDSSSFTTLRRYLISKLDTEQMELFEKLYELYKVDA